LPRSHRRRWARDILALGIAYARQERRYGGLTKSVAKELDRLLARALGDGNGTPELPTQPLPRAGTILVRDHVTVTDDGFLWNGKPHRSLSSIARAISGTTWNGPKRSGSKARIRIAMRRLRSEIEAQYAVIQALDRVASRLRSNPELAARGRGPIRNPISNSMLRMRHKVGRVLRNRVCVAGAGDRGIGRTEQAGRVRLPQPGVQVVVMQRQWNQRFMSLHWPIERLAKDCRPLLDARLQRYEPFDRHKPQLVAFRFINQDRGAYWIGLGTDKLRVEEVNAHAAGGIRDAPVTPTIRIVHASQRGKIAVSNGDVGVLVLVERGTDFLKLWRQHRSLSTPV
jgi:hypothetical protein